MRFTPGDMCVVIDDPGWTDRSRLAIGIHVVIIDGPVTSRTDDPYWAPYYQVSGIPKFITDTQEDEHKGRMSGRCLRKIPPADLGLDVLTEEECTA